MYVYYLLIFLIVIACLIEKQTNSNRLSRNIFMIIFMLFAFRAYDVGVDTPRYIEEYILGETYLRGIDIGYATYASFLGSLGLSSRLFLLISSFLLLFPFFMYVKKAGMPRSFTILLYVTIGTFAMQLSGLRQSLAVSIIILGVVLSIDISRKWLRYLILITSVLLAQTFHHTALVGLLFVLMFLFMEREVRVNGFWTLLLALLPIVLFYTSNVFAPLVNQLTVDRYENYEIGSGNINIVAFFLIPYVIFLYTLWLSWRVGLDNKFERIGLMCAIIYMVCASASLYMPILARIENYFSLPMLVLISHLTNKTNQALRQPLYLVIGFICILFFIVSTSGGNLQIDNYHFSLQ